VDDHALLLAPLAHLSYVLWGRGWTKSKTNKPGQLKDLVF